VVNSATGRNSVSKKRLAIAQRRLYVRGRQIRAPGEDRAATFLERGDVMTKFLTADGRMGMATNKDIDSLNEDALLRTAQRNDS